VTQWQEHLAILPVRVASPGDIPEHWPRRLSRVQAAKPLGERLGPTPVSERMHLHPHPVLPLVEFERARSARNSKVPVMASGSSRKLALAPNHKSSTEALPECLLGTETEIHFQHEPNLLVALRRSGVIPGHSHSRGITSVFEREKNDPEHQRRDDEVRPHRSHALQIRSSGDIPAHWRKAPSYR
jgi:hypothetical protein